MNLLENQYEEAANLLEESGQYKILRRVPERLSNNKWATAPLERIALIIDTETTGLDINVDEIIEIGAIAFSYGAEKGEFIGIVDTYAALSQPSASISKKITSLTGISDEMVAGKQIDKETLRHLIAGSGLIIAHNASFDRPICERYIPAFSEKPWACSATEVPWIEAGFEGAKLSYLLSQSGLFYDGHRALGDCRALLEILIKPLPVIGGTALQYLLRSARQARFRIETSNAFNASRQLRARGYRWSGNRGGNRRYWWIEVPENGVRDELSALDQIDPRAAENAVLRRLTAYDRYKADT
jgi:DNA polymerase-3 subunit epsilon